MTVLTELNYTKEIALLYNSEIINQLCDDIDDNHPRQRDLKEILLSAISSYDFPEGDIAIQKVKDDIANK